jgi:DNA mismatch repair endonuclease MutH
MINKQQRQYIKSNLGYDPYSEKEILKHAKKAKGKTIQELLDTSPLDIKSTKSGNKGRVGNLVEENWFGIPNNSEQAPDFEKVGIELKVIPVHKVGNKGWQVKEDTKITSINYMGLIHENWIGSHAKKKLEKILFIFYSYIKEDPNNSNSPLDLSQCKVIDIGLWELMKNDEHRTIKDDWEGIQNKVMQGMADKLSQKDSLILSAKTAGKNKLDKVEQPNKTFEETARRRAFALKRAFTNQYWDELRGRSFESISKIFGLSPQEDYEQKLLEKLHILKGKNLQEIADIYDLYITSSAKNSVAILIRKAIGFKNIKSRIKEFEQRGLEIKTIPVRPMDNRPWESTSFPTMKLQEFVEEEWESSTLYNYLEKVLFIPIYRDQKDTPLQNRVFGRAFYWSPSDQELEIIKKEWTMYQQEVRSGLAKVHLKGEKEVTGLSKESETNIIHIRPHGRDRTDRDIDPHGNSVVKQSFWLNKKFVQKLIINSLEK